jgi:glutathione S-transferase
MLKIYHATGTRSVRPVWLCYELGLEIEVTRVEFSPAFLGSAAWRAISPTGKLPALTDGELTMCESGAMVDYILDRYGEGRLRPPIGTPARALCQQWCWLSEATLLRPLGLSRLLRDPPEAVVADALARTRDCIGVVEAALAGGAFLLGEAFCAADIMMGYSLALLETMKLVDAAAHPHATAYVARLKTRDALQRAMRA